MVDGHARKDLKFEAKEVISGQAFELHCTPQTADHVSISWLSTVPVKFLDRRARGYEANMTCGGLVDINIVHLKDRTGSLKMLSSAGPCFGWV